METQALTGHNDIIVSATGHRPDKLNNEYDIKGPLSEKLYLRTKQIVEIINPKLMISGMALGYDMIFANVAIRSGIPFIAAVPFGGQEQKWPATSQKLYHNILRYADDIVIVSEGGYTARKMQTRNEWMIDKSDIVIAVWDGTTGGTANAVSYAKQVGKAVLRLNPTEFLARLL
jgi:uncharacterized phage-like protein YoqJ